MPFQKVFKYFYNGNHDLPVVNGRAIWHKSDNKQ